MYHRLSHSLPSLLLMFVIAIIAAGAVVAQDVTFYHISDPHYSVRRDNDEVLAATIKAMNNLPGEDYPVAMGGQVETPCGVIITGDLTNDATPEDWRGFDTQWGLLGREGLIRFPVYEGAGNHDGAPGSIVGKRQGYVRSQIVERNKRRPNVKNVSENGLHYSWDWGGVHFVCLNEYAGQENATRYPGNTEYGRKRQAYGNPAEMSLQFLAADLAKSVGDSDRPIILAQHYGFDGFAFHPWGEEAAWWTEEHALRLWETLEGYNVICILSGHDGSEAVFDWHGIPNRHMDDMTRFGVYRIQDNKMDVAIRNASNGKWEKTWSQSTRIDSSLPDQLIQGPYLVYDGNPTQITVCWRTSTSEPCTLCWGDNHFCYEGGTVEVEPYDQKRGLYQQKITGLSPGSRVNYTLEINGKYAPGMFYTPAAEAGRVKFLIAHTPTNLVRRNRLFRTMYELIYQDPAYHSFLLHPGQLASQPQTLPIWDHELFSRLAAGKHIRYMLSRLPIASCPGTSDLSRRLFPRTSEEDASGYSFKYGPVHVAMVGCQSTETLQPSEKEWLRRNLQSAKAQWKFVCITTPGDPAHAKRPTDSLQALLSECDVHVYVTIGEQFSCRKDYGVTCVSLGPANGEAGQYDSLLAIAVEEETLSLGLLNEKNEAVQIITHKR